MVTCCVLPAVSLYKIRSLFLTCLVCLSLCAFATKPLDMLFPPYNQEHFFLSTKAQLTPYAERKRSSCVIVFGEHCYCRALKVSSLLYSPMQTSFQFYPVGISEIKYAQTENCLILDR